MIVRLLGSFLALVCLMNLGSCTARYQDLLRDRDVQIRELTSRVTDLRAANSDLERRERGARSELEAVKGQLSARPVEASADRGELDKVRNDLPDLDVRYNRGRLSIGIENSVTFDSGSTAIKPSANRVLDRVVSVLRRDFATRRIYVEGHTDTDPIRKTRGRFRSNRHLSAERADHVAAYLAKKGGLPERQIVVVGYGPHDPRTPGVGDAAKTRNRRVEIVVGEDI